MSNKGKKGGASDFGPKGWIIVLISAVYFYLSTAVTSDGANTINAVMQQKFALQSLAPLTIGQTVGGWLALLTIPVFTALSQKVGAKTVLLVSLAIFAVCTYFIFNASTVGMYRTAVTIACADLVGFSMVGVGQLGANWFPTKKGMFMGIATMGIPVAAASVNLMMSKMMEVMPFGNIAWFFIGVSIITFILTVVFVKNNPEEAGAYPDNDHTMTKEKAAEIAAKAEAIKASSPWTTKKVLSFKETWMIALGWGLMMGGAGGIISQFVAAGISWGHPMSYPIMLLTVMFPLGLFTSWLIGYIDTKWGTKTASLVVCGMEIFGAVVAGLFGHNGIALALGGGCFMGAMSGGNNLTMSVTGTKFGRFDFNNAWAVISMITRALSSTFIVLVSLVAGKVGYTGAYLGVAATVVVAALIILKTDLTCVGRITIDD